MTKPTRSLWLAVFTAALCSAASLSAQQSQVSSSTSDGVQSPVPRLIKFSGTILDEQEQPMKSPASVTFALYGQQSDGPALWMETQNVETDAKGNYTVLLGANSANGVPADLFNSGEARWLGAQAERQPEQPRVLLVSVPYALKAGDAQTLGGLPPSAFAPAGSVAGSAWSSATAVAPSVTVLAPSLASAAPLTTSCAGITADGTATVNQVAKFSGPCTIHQSILVDNGTSVSVTGSFSLPAIAAANNVIGSNSQPLDFLTSSFSSSPVPGIAVMQHFRWQAEPVGNNTATPSGKLNLLFASGKGIPAETGLSISNTGLINFVKGQTFPLVTGNETLTGNFTAGGSVSGAGAKFTGPVTTGAETVNGNITDTGNITATGVVTASSYEIGGNLFAYGSRGNQNAFLGFAGSATRTAFGNTAVGPEAEANVTNGVANTAMGAQALFFNSLGSHNTAFGFAALTNSSEDIDGNNNSWNTAIGDFSLGRNQSGNLNTAIGFNSGTTEDQSNITTGSDNTFLGPNSALLTGTLNYATAIGANAEVDKSNAMVLGGISGVNGCTGPCSNTLVGIGTTAPTARLHIGNMGSTSFKNFLRIEGPTTQMGFPGIADVSLGGFGNFEIDAPGVEAGRFLVREDGMVAIGLSNPGHNPPPVRPLYIEQTWGRAIADGWDTFSSRRWKTNIHPLPDALNKVERLRGVSYDLKKSGKHEIGVIAEEVGEVVPEVVTYEKNGKDAEGVDYSRLTALLIEAVKQQQREITALRSQLRTQAAKSARLESRLTQIEADHDGHSQLASVVSTR